MVRMLRLPPTLAQQQRRHSTLRSWRRLLGVSPGVWSTAPPHSQGRRGQLCRAACRRKSGQPRLRTSTADFRCARWRWHLQPPGWMWAQETEAPRPSESHARGQWRRPTFSARRRSWGARHASPLHLPCRSRSLLSRIPGRRPFYPGRTRWHAVRRSLLSVTGCCLE